MDELLSEKEQIEQLRTWWSDYGYYVIGGVVLGALILFGFNYYQNAEIKAQEAASTQFDAVATAIAESDLEAAEAAAAELSANFGNSAYDAQSKLAMARLYMDKNRDQDAAESLRSLMATSGVDSLQHVGRVRLGKILLYQGEPEEVLTLLEGQDSEAFAARYAELRGDAYVALDRPEEARAEYQAALLEQLPTVDQGLIQLKLMDLPRESIAMGDGEGAERSNTEPEPAVEETAEDAAEESAE